MAHMEMSEAQRTGTHYEQVPLREVKGIIHDLRSKRKDEDVTCTASDGKISVRDSREKKKK
jgi:hypothetical protein